MSSYGELAKLAASRARQGANPVEAWKDAAEDVFPTKKASREKGCPKCAFLGLAEEGLIRGVQPGRYTRSRDNKHYALVAVAALRSDPELANDADRLWEIVMDGVTKKHNEQMCVVSALWQNGDIPRAT